MKKTKTSSELFFSVRAKSKLKKASLTLSGALLLCSVVNAQNPGTDAYNNTRLGTAANGTVWTPQYTDNTAVGFTAMLNAGGSMNTCVGSSTFNGIGTGSSNSALGYMAMYSNTSGGNNCALGRAALYANTGGSGNVASGLNALTNNTSGNYNVALGIYSVQNNTSGIGNTGIGAWALTYTTTTSYNTALGYNSGPGANGLTNSTAIGNGTVVNASNKIRFGNSNVTVIEGTVAFTSVSDGRFKTNISESDVKGLDFIKKLRPVVYNLDTKKLDAFLKKDLPESARKNDQETDFTASTAIRQSGFIAQEVEIAAKETGYNFNGIHVPENESDNYGLAYAQFVVPLVKAVQELSTQNEEQKLANDALKKELDELKMMIKSISSGNVISPVEPSESKLYQNAPNPSNESTSIKYAISPLTKKATLKIVGMNGSTLKEIDLTGNGNGSIEINAGELAPGNYVYSLIIDNKVIDSKKMTLTK
jgi:hypothetical protein